MMLVCSVYGYAIAPFQKILRLKRSLPEKDLLLITANKHGCCFVLPEGSSLLSK